MTLRKLSLVPVLLAGSLAAPAYAVSPKHLWHDQPAGSALVPSISQAFPSLAPLVKLIRPAVVNIATSQRIRHPGWMGNPQDPFGQFFQQFFGGQIPQQELTRQSLGSGFLIDEKGYVLTNNHVIEGADQIKVKLADGRELPAKVIGADSKTDVALLKLAGRGPFPYLLLGDSDVLHVGDWVVAIGNPFGLELSVTHGMVSAKERTIGAGPYDDFIQSDALINPGNSGGPLFDMEGAVIGINTAITAHGQGIGFAVPINIAKQLLPQLVTGHVIRGWLGVGIQRLTPDLATSLGLGGTKGALVAEVMRGGPAARAGFKSGDVVVSLNGTPVNSPSELTRGVAIVRPGSKIAVGVVRNGKPQTLSVRVGERPDDGMAPSGRGGEPGGQPGPPAERRPDALGLAVAPLDPDLAQSLGIAPDDGVQVAGVEQNSSAAEAGVRPGDVIVEVNRRPVHSPKEYDEALRATGTGEMTLLRVQRGHQSIYFAVRAGG